MTKEKEFLLKLKQLLEEYDADIITEIEGDTHGINTDLVIKVKGKEVFRSYYTNWLDSLVLKDIEDK